MLLMQGATLVPFDSAELVGERPRNATIATYDGRRLMVYRHGSLGCTKELRLAELDQHYNLLSDRVLLNGDNPCEDPRLSLFNDRLWVSYHMANQGKRSIGVTEVIPNAVPLVGPSWEFPKFQDVEKNWVPLAYDGQGGWWWSYDLNGQHHVKHISGSSGKVSREVKGPGCPAQYGPARGGTNFYPWSRTEYLTIAHSSMNVGAMKRRYVAFPVLVSAVPPYGVLQTGRLIMAGDAFAGGYASGMMKAVVFPCGLDCHGNGFIISLGYNDREVRLVQFDRSSLARALRQGPAENPLSALTSDGFHC